MSPDKLLPWAAETQQPGLALSNRFDSAHIAAQRQYAVISAVEQATRVRERPSAFLFEFSNVLFDSTAWQRWLLRVLKRLNVHCDYAGLFAVWEQHYLVEVHRGRREFAEAFAAYLRELGLTNGQIDEVEAASQPRRLQFVSDIRPLPGVRRTLDQLSADGAALGVLADSEFTSSGLLHQVEQLGLAGRFGVVLSSLDIGSVKPDHAGYLAAIEAFEIPAERIAFVGHHPAHLRAATQLGMSTVAFNNDSLVTADLYLDRFDELLSNFREWPL